MSFGPSSALQSMMGMPAKKPIRRGRGKGGKSGKPGVQHLTALNQAHAAGNFAQAKTHALNFAKALHSHLSGAVGPAAPPADLGGDEDGAPTIGGAPAPQHFSESTGVDTDSPSSSPNFIQGAIKHPGALHAQLGVPQGQQIPAKKLSAAASSPNPLEAKRAHLAMTLKKLRPK